MAVSAPVQKKKTNSRIVIYLGVLFIIGIVVVLAMYQEQVSSFFKLRLWDKRAPGNAVTSFLTAGKKGDQKTADSYLGSPDIKPMSKNGKWIGYFLATQAGKMEFTFDELASDNPQVSNTDFILLGKGAAEVSVPDAKSKPVKYRLEMGDNGWKITEILGGHPAH